MENENNQSMNGFSGNIATFKEAISVFKKYWMPFIIAMVAFVIAYLLLQSPQLMYPKSESYFMNPWQAVGVSMVAMILGLVFFIVYLVVQVGVCKIIIDGVRDTKPNIHDLYLQYRRAPSYLFTSVVAAIISFIGLFLFVFAIFPLTARYQFAFLFVIDKKVGMAESLRLSDLATRGSLWKIIKFDFFLFFVNIIWYILALILFAMGVGIIAALPLLGLIITWPLSIVAYVVAYKKFADNPAQNVVEHNGMMVGIILALFAVLVVVMVIIGGAIAAMIMSNPMFKYAFEEQQKSYMGESGGQGMPYLQTADQSESGDENAVGENSTFNQTFKSSFVDSCSLNAGEAVCSCMADYVFDNYSEDQLMALSSGGEGTTELTKTLTEAAAQCADK